MRHIIWLDCIEVAFDVEMLTCFWVNHKGNAYDEDGNRVVHRRKAKSIDELRDWYRRAGTCADNIGRAYHEEKADLARSGNDPNNKYFALYN